MAAWTASGATQVHGFSRPQPGGMSSPFLSANKVWLPAFGTDLEDYSDHLYEPRGISG